MAGFVMVVDDETRAFYQRRGWADEGLFDYGAANPTPETTEADPIAVSSHRYAKTVG